MKKETTMEMYERMLEERVKAYWEFYKVSQDSRDFNTWAAYKSALDMFQYAKKDDRAELAQYDYFGEDY